MNIEDAILEALRANPQMGASPGAAPDPQLTQEDLIALLARMSLEQGQQQMQHHPGPEPVALPGMDDVMPGAKSRMAAGLDTARMVGQGMVAAVPAGYAGLTELMAGRGFESANDVIQARMAENTYMPQHPEVARSMEEGGNMQRAFEALDYIPKSVGDSAEYLTGSPGAAATAYTLAGVMDPWDVAPGLAAVPMLAKLAPTKPTAGVMRNQAGKVVRKMGPAPVSLAERTAVRAAVRKALNIPEGGAIPQNEMRAALESVRKYKREHSTSPGVAHDPVLGKDVPDPGFKGVTVVGVEKTKSGWKVKLDERTGKALDFHLDPTTGKPYSGARRQTVVSKGAAAMTREVQAIAARARAGDPVAQKVVKAFHWYRDVRNKLYDTFGGAAVAAGELEAGTSPNTKLPINHRFAMQLLRAHMRGEFDDQLAVLDTILRSGRQPSEMEWQQLMPKQLAAAGGQDKKFGMQGRNATLVLLDSWRKREVGAGPKARLYGRHLLGQGGEPVIDVWAGRWVQRLLGGKRPVPELNRVGGEYTGPTVSNPPRKLSAEGARAVEAQFRRTHKLKKDAEIPASLKGKLNAAKRRALDVEIATYQGNNVLPDGGTLTPQVKSAGGSKKMPEDVRGIITGISDEYGIASDMMEQSARALRETQDAVFRDILPEDLQAIGWVREKLFWEENRWSPVDETPMLDAMLPGINESSAGRRGATRLQAGVSAETYGPGEYAPARNPVAEGVSEVTGSTLPGPDVNPGGRPGGVMNEMDFTRARAQLLQGMDEDANILVARAPDTHGKYFGTVERAFDAEWVVRGNARASEWRIVTNVARAAKDGKQIDAFVSRVAPYLRDMEIPANGRPGVEVYLDPELAQKVLPQLEALLNAADEPGFTMVKDSLFRAHGSTVSQNPSGMVGVRFQWVPEINARYDADFVADIQSRPGRLAEIRDERLKSMLDFVDRAQELEGVAAARSYMYDTVVFGKENYDDFIRPSAAEADKFGRAPPAGDGGAVPASNLRGTTGGGSPFGGTLDENVARAIERYGKGGGQADPGAGDVLRGGSPDEVTGATPVKKKGLGEPAQALPVQQQQGSTRELSMDPGARAERARDMGFNVDAFHGTDAAEDFTQFEHRAQGSGGFHFGAGKRGAEAANDRVNMAIAWDWTPAEIKHHLNAVRNGSQIQPRVLPVKLRAKKPYKTDDLNTFSARTLLEQLSRDGATAKVPFRAKEVESLRDEVVSVYQFYARKGGNDIDHIVVHGPLAKGAKTESPYYFDTVRKQNAAELAARQLIWDFLEKHGYDSLQYTNVAEAPGSRAVVVWRPEQIRSVFAKFDPRRAKSGNIMAGIAAGAVVAGTLDRDEHP